MQASGSREPILLLSWDLSVEIFVHGFAVEFVVDLDFVLTWCLVSVRVLAMECLFFLGSDWPARS